MANNETGRAGAIITKRGWAALSGREVQELTGVADGPEWEVFRNSWSALGPDRYMADGGRYRRRRHAVLALIGGEAHTLPPRPHYQSRDYNPLNGGVERWFAQVQPEVLGGPVLHALLTLCRDVFPSAVPPARSRCISFASKRAKLPAILRLRACTGTASAGSACS